MIDKLKDFLQRNKEKLLFGKPVCNTEIIEVEKMLGLRFADDYKSILEKYGFICINGHEITGITSAKRLNVYDVTIEERTNIDYNMSKLYVIEQAHIDGIVIWQSELGEVYMTGPNLKPVKVADNIMEYIK